MQEHRTVEPKPDGWGITWPPVGSFPWPRSGEDIGELTDRRHSAIQHCLMDNWVMAGHIIKLDPDRMHGKVRIAGRRG